MRLLQIRLQTVIKVSQVSFLSIKEGTLFTKMPFRFYMRNQVNIFMALEVLTSIFDHKLIITDILLTFHTLMLPTCQMKMLP